MLVYHAIENKTMRNPELCVPHHEKESKITPEYAGWALVFICIHMSNLKTVTTLKIGLGRDNILHSINNNELQKDKLYNSQLYPSELIRDQR